MKKILIILLFFSLQLAYSQQKNKIVVGAIIYDSNIRIENDSIMQRCFVTDKGYCYAILTRFKNTGVKDVDKVKKLIDIGKEWEIMPENHKDNYSKYICETNDGVKRYEIVYEGLDADERGLVLTEEFLNTKSIEPYGYPVKDWDRFISVEEVILQVKDRQQELISSFDEETKLAEREKFAERQQQDSINEQESIKLKQQSEYDNTPVENIELPYKFKFGMTESQVLMQLKSLLSPNSTFEYKEIAASKLDKLFNSKVVIYIVKTANAFSFSVTVVFYKGKAFEYQYHHEDALDQKLREKIEVLLRKYSKLATFFGNEIYVKSEYQQIQKLKADYENRGQIMGDKM